jgi:anti-anti-sigma regulatory factor
MAGKKKKTNYFEHSVSGEFDAKAASNLEDALVAKLDGSPLKGAVIDFSEATIITAAGIAGLRRIGAQMHKDKKELIISAMKSEMYKALKVAGTPDGLAFSHRSVS